MQTIRGGFRGAAVGGAIMAALCGTAANADTPADGPSANKASDTELQEIVVTGSLIKRTDTETPSPVQVISADDIKNTGYTNISDVMRNLSANGQGALSQSFGQAFASGGSGVALRGLTVGGTLTLIDGERMVSYPLSDDNQRSFVDISAIPFNAVDSVEVLKDGASALYGADAIAGVVNVKLKKQYVGSEFTAEAGTSQHADGTTEHLAGIMGWGDLASDGYNLYVAVDFHHQDKILGANRSAGFTNLDWSGLPDGINTTQGAANNPYIPYTNSITGYLINPNTASGQPYTFLPGCTQAKLNANQCEFSFPGLIQPPSEQTNLLAKFTKNLAGNWALTVTGSLFDSSAQQIAAGNQFDAYPNTGYATGGITNIPFGPGLSPSLVSYPVITVPANFSGNPYGVPAALVYSFADVGPQITDIETTTYRLYADLKGAAGGWDLEAAAGAMYSRMGVKQYGDLEPALVQTAINNGTYVPGASNNNVSLIAPVAAFSPSSALDVLDLHGTRELAQLPGGPLAMGIGAQYFHKAQNAQFASAIVSGVQEGDPVYSIGSQDDTAAFLELQAQVFKQLEVNGAVRYDHYDTYGGSTTPKFGVKYTPFDSFAVRGTWGKGFRAPSTSEAGSSGELFGAGATYDPVLCPNGVSNVKGTFNGQCGIQLTGYQVSNPDLKAVTSTNLTFGVIFEPTKNFNVSLDYYQIKLENDVISQFEAGGLNDYTSLVRGPVATLPVCTNTVTTGTCTTVNEVTPVGLASFAEYPYVNAGTTKTEGIDLDLRTNFELGVVGKFIGELNYTHIILYDETVQGTTFDLAGTHGPSGISGDTGNPKDRATASLTWEKDAASVTASVNYVGPFSITDPSAGLSTCLAALSGSATSAYGLRIAPGVTSLPSQWYPYCSVKSFIDTNLYGQYLIGDHLNVHLSVTNLFNVSAPVDLQTYGGGGELAYDGALHQDGAIGRFFLLGATYKFQ